MAIGQSATSAVAVAAGLGRKAAAGTKFAAAAWNGLIAAAGGTAVTTGGAADLAASTGTRVAATTSGTWPLADASGTAALTDADAGGRDSGPSGLERARPLPACASASTRDRVEVKSVSTTVDGT